MGVSEPDRIVKLQRSWWREVAEWADERAGEARRAALRNDAQRYDYIASQAWGAYADRSSRKRLRSTPRG